MEITPALRQQLLVLQKEEINGYEMYRFIASTLPQSENRRVLEKIAADEMDHYLTWKGYTGQEVSPDRLKVAFYKLLVRLLGFTFVIKLMENGEEKAQSAYAAVNTAVPEVASVLRAEEGHEDQLMAMLDEERLRYASSVVLGLNDALVELTGALAGFTLALQNVKLIALSGLITGIAAAFSMAASEYLSTRDEKSEKQPVRAAVYTGIAYIITVALLILPFLLLTNPYISLGIALVTAVVIIAMFNYYISVARGEPFRRRFIEMAAISLGVAGFSFLLSYFIRLWLGVNL